MTDLPQSAYLSLSMKRAISAAQQRSHRYVTLEHLLFALLDDPSANEILEGVRADLPSIRVAINETVNRNLTKLQMPGRIELRASYKVERVLQTASDDADRLNCDEVDAAFVVAALSRENDSPAADILKRNGFSHSAAVTWLYANRGMTPAARAARSKNKPITIVPEPGPEPEKEKAKAPPKPDMGGGAGQPGEQAGQPSMADEEPLELNREIAEEIDNSAPLGASKPVTDTKAREELAAMILRRQPPPQAAPNEAERERRPSPEPPARPVAGEKKLPGRLSGPIADPVRDIQKPPNPAPREERRKEPVLPPPSRLDEMRISNGPTPFKQKYPLPGPAAPPPAPPPTKKRKRKPAQTDTMPVPMPVPEDERQKGRSRRPLRRHEALIGRLIENIPRRMRAETAERIEVRISREETQALSQGLEGRAEPVRHDIMVTQTMSVALRAPDGGFIIEPLSPETQWIFDRPEPGNADIYGRWRWAVTPLYPGKMRLQLIVAARSIGPNGIVGDTALPDQVITISIRTNYWRSLGRGLKWIAAMILGGVITELAVMGMRVLGQ
jgi:hypothetical protein